MPQVPAAHKAIGAEVLVTSRREEKSRWRSDPGVTEVFDYKADPEWGKAVYAATGGVGKVINNAGVGSLNPSMTALKPGGNIVSVGLMTQAAELDEYAFLGKGLTLHGVPGGGRDGLLELLAFIDASGLRPIIRKVFAFNGAKRACEEQHARDLFGKIEIEIA